MWVSQSVKVTQVSFHGILSFPPKFDSSLKIKEERGTKGSTDQRMHVSQAEWKLLSIWEAPTFDNYSNDDSTYLP